MNRPITPLNGAFDEAVATIIELSAKHKELSTEYEKCSALCDLYRMERDEKCTEYDALVASRVTFEVCAGKLEQGEIEVERNYKYIELFDEYDIAVAAYDSCADYHFRELSIVQFRHHQTIKE